MAAANTDKLRKLSRKWVGQIGSGAVADAVVTTIPLSSTTNLPTDTAVTLVLGRVDSAGTKTPSAEETIVGVVSGTNIVNAVRGVEGTAQSHAAGVVVEMLVTADGYNDIIDAFLVGHSQLGAHGDVCATTLESVGATTVGTTLGVTGKTTASDIDACAITGQSLAITNGKITASDIDACAITGKSMVLTEKIGVGTEAYFDAEVDDGSSGATDTINWTTGNKHKSTLSENCTYTFTAPTGPANLILKLVNGGAFTPTWPATVKWPAGTEPTWTASGTDVVALYYDGTNYYSQGSLDFS